MPEELFYFHHIIRYFAILVQVSLNVLWQTKAFHEYALVSFWYFEDLHLKDVSQLIVLVLSESDKSS